MTGGTLADLNIRITSNLAQIQSSLGGIQGQLNTLGSRMKSALNFTAVSLGLTGIVSTLKELVSIGVKYDANMEQTKIAFDRLFGKDSQKMLQDITSLAEATPFEFPELADATARLKAFNFEASAIPSILIAAGDASSAMGKGTEGMNRIITALSQIQAKGKVSAEEMNQLAEVGINGFKYIADSMGISEAKARQMAEKGLIPVNKALKEIVIAMERDFGGMMDKQSKTAIGLWSTLKDNIKSTLGELTLGIMNQAKPAMDTLINKLKLFKEGFKVGGLAQAMYNILPNELFVKFVRLYDAINGIYTVAKPIIEGFVQGFVNATEYIYNLFTSLGKSIQSSLGKMGISIDDKQLKDIGISLGTIAAAALAINIVLSPIVKLFTILSPIVRTIGTGLQYVWTLLNGGWYLVAGIASQFSFLTMIIRGAFTSALSGSFAGILLLLRALPSVIVSTLLNPVRGAFQAMASLSTTLGLTMGTRIFGTLASFLNGFMNLFTRAWFALIRWIGVAFSAVVGALTTTIMGLPAWIVGLLAAAAFAIGALIGTLITATYRWITGSTSTFGEAWDSTISDTLGAFKALWDGFISYAKTAINWVIEKFRAIKEWFGIANDTESVNPYTIEELTGRSGKSSTDLSNMIDRFKIDTNFKLPELSTPKFDIPAISASFDNMTGSIDNSTTALKKLQDTFKDVIDEIKNAADGIVTFGNAFDKISYDRFSPAKLVSRVKRFFEEISKWTKNLDILASRGVDQNILNQLRGMGVQGYGITAGLAQANEAQLAQITSLYGQSRAMAVGVASDKVQVEHMGTITVKGVNDAGQLKAVVDLVAKDINANASKYTNNPSPTNLFK